MFRIDNLDSFVVRREFASQNALLLAVYMLPVVNASDVPNIISFLPSTGISRHAMILFYIIYLSITPEQATITPLLRDLSCIITFIKYNVQYCHTPWIGLSNTYPNDF